MHPPHPTPHQGTVASYDPTTNDCARQYVSIPGKQFQVLEGYPKDAGGWLERNQMFIDELTKEIKWNLY